MLPSPKFASLQGILLEESDAVTGVVSAEAEGRLEIEMRRTLIDFFERFFLWCALFRPVKGSRGDYLRFLRIARGSAYELETQLVLAVDLGLCDDARARRVAELLQEVIRVLQGLIAVLERRTEG